MPESEGGFLRVRGGSEPLPTSLGVLRGTVSSVTAENFEFGALWDLKIASKHFNVATKLYERV